MKTQLVEVLIHEGMCIHYIWKPGCPATTTDPKVWPEVTLTSVSYGEKEYLNLLEHHSGSLGERYIEDYIQAVLEENKGRA